MKNLLLTVACLFVLAGAAFSQEKDAKQRTEMFRQEITKADWKFFLQEDGASYYVDSLTMKRMMNTVVVFLVKSETKENIEYTKNIGGCTKHIVATANRLTSAPGEKALTGGELESPKQVVVSKGMISYSILEYVCKNATELELKN
jgi:hypothetical protein